MVLMCLSSSCSCLLKLNDCACVLLQHVYVNDIYRGGACNYEKEGAHNYIRLRVR